MTCSKFNWSLIDLKEIVIREWTRAKETDYPDLPEKLFPYQVTPMDKTYIFIYLQVDAISCLMDPEDKRHVFVGVPTGRLLSHFILLAEVANQLENDLNYN